MTVAGKKPLAMHSILTPFDAAGPHDEPDDARSKVSSTSRDQGMSVFTRLGGEVNWLWFAPAAGRACALVIGEITPPYRRGLSTRFDRVERIPLTTLQRVAVSDESGASHARLTYDDGTVDGVVSVDLVTTWSHVHRSPFQDPQFGVVLAELRRLLRPGGFLFLSGPNPRWHRTLLRRDTSERALSGLNLRDARAAMAGAGFSETQAYFVEPFSVVPACRRAAFAYERQRWPRTHAFMRGLWAAVGLHDLLYPEAFILAIK
ncbi:MAG TPA: hypothetical protein VKB50_12095 [Vicinamibacterales bacterium]|nr:hypothetical protein [Vicinamibacterales bacterium]